MKQISRQGALPGGSKQNYFIPSIVSAMAKGFEIGSPKQLESDFTPGNDR